jgi:hypothetical protein
MASQFLLGTLNRIDATTLTGGSWMGSLPLSNIKDRRLSRLARSTNALAASTMFDLDLGAPRSVGVIALVAHNLSVTATVRVLGDDASDFATPVYDSGAVAVWPAGVIPQSLLEWEDDNFWLGTVSQEALAGFKTPFIVLPASAQTLRYWRVSITDTSNPDGYVQIGRVYIGSAWQPDFDRSYGASLGYDDVSQVEESLSGEEFYDVRRKRRIHRFELGWLSQTEALDRVLDMQRLQGTTGEILIVPNVTDTTNRSKVSFLGRLKSLDPVPQHLSQYWSSQFEIQEIL